MKSGTTTPTASGPQLTETDKSALRKMPEGWFEWYDLYNVRCPEFRLRRLVDRGMVEQRITGEWPDIEVRYRLKAEAKEVKP